MPPAPPVPLVALELLDAPCEALLDAALMPPAPLALDAEAPLELEPAVVVVAALEPAELELVHAAPSGATNGGRANPSAPGTPRSGTDGVRLGAFMGVDHNSARRGGERRIGAAGG